MPQLSSWNQKAGQLFSMWMNLRRWRFFKFALGEDPFNIFDVLLEADANKKFQIEECLRYSTDLRVQYQDGDATVIFNEDLKEDSPWLNNAEFKDKYRMTCLSFWLIVDLINNHLVFQSMKRKQAPIDHQLMMLLCFLGTEGNGMSNRKGCSVFRAPGKGTLRVYNDRVAKAILDCLYEDFVKWPNPNEW
jgi:hypothetical protein